MVLKLLLLTQPQHAYFGRKDAQQLAVVRQMAHDLNVPVTIVGCDTVREPDGLAMSSRNAALSREERAAAPVVHRALRAALDAWKAGRHDADDLRALMRGVIDTEPLADIDYVSVADGSMAELQTASDGAIASLAVRIGPTRLIDNLVLEFEADEAGARVTGPRAGEALMEGAI